MHRISQGGQILSDEDGFNMIELSIIVLILAIILSLAVINYTTASRSMTLKGAQRQVEAALTRAMNAARQENVDYRLIFYPHTHAFHPNSYEFLHLEENNAGSWSLVSVDRSVSGEEVVTDNGHYYVVLSNGVKVISEDVIVVDFLPRGTTMSITPSTITLGLGSATLSVSIDAQGKVSPQ